MIAQHSPFDAADFLLTARDRREYRAAAYRMRDPAVIRTARQAVRRSCHQA